MVGFRWGLIPAHAGKTRPPPRAATYQTAHPRSRGENVGGGFGGHGVVGSSPLTRGKPLQGGAEEGLRGLIPAHAGKTTRAHLPTARGRAHPRSRGENIDGEDERPGDVGSSPLTRGKHHGTDRRRTRRGLIPAHAGKTNALTCHHPPPVGSSPLTRGKPVRVRFEHSIYGLIPAHAGKTSSTNRIRSRTWAHPRSRGENRTLRRLRSRLRGSSPLTRGKRGDAPPGPAFLGLIPAHAGKTGPTSPRPPTPRAHPRSRGENTGILIATAGYTGSSPLTRGKRVKEYQKRVSKRLIPAHAGKTHRRSAPNGIKRAHPRSRGENTRKMGLAAIVAGSSPLTRGKRY